MSLCRWKRARTALIAERCGEVSYAKNVSDSGMTHATGVTRNRQKPVSFIVRLWLEGGEAPRSSGGWRGCIEAVDTDRRMYFNDLSGFCKLLQSELQKLGANV